MPATSLVILVPSLAVGGTERQAILLARGITSLDPELAARTMVVTLAAGGEFERDVPGPIRLISLHTSRRTAPLALWRFVRLVRKERPEVVYSLLVPANLICAAASIFAPARWIWGHRSQHLSMRSSAGTRRVIGHLLRIGSQRSDGVIVNSAAAEAFLRSIGVRTPARLVRNAVDPSDFDLDPTARASTRGELALKLDDHLVLSVGRLVADKDHPTLVRCFAAVLAVDSAAHLVIVGAGDNEARESLMHLARTLDVAHRVHLIGQRSDLNRWYNAADVLVQSSINEGLSNVLLEAAAVGCPAVSTDCGDAAALLPPDQVVPVGEPLALAAAAVHVLGAGRSLRGTPTNDHSVADLAQATLDFLGLRPSLVQAGSQPKTLGAAL